MELSEYCDAGLSQHQKEESHQETMAFRLYLDYPLSYFYFLAFFFVAFFLVAFFFAFFFAILVPPCKKSFVRAHSASPILVCILIAWHISFNKISGEIEEFF